MSDTQKLGPDRCYMQKGEGRSALGPLKTTGGAYIRNRLAAGWHIVEHPDNHIKDLDAYRDLLGNGGTPAPAHAEDGSSLERNASDHSGDPQPKKRGRPPGSKNLKK